MKMKTRNMFTLSATLLLAGTAAAQYTPVSQLTYTNINNQIVITGADESVRDLRVPPVITGLPVTEIGPLAFQTSIHLTNCVLSASVTVIGDVAFGVSRNLRSIEMPRVEVIGTQGLGTTGLTELNLPGTLLTIGEGAFLGSPALATIRIPARVTSIGGSAFAECPQLTSVTFEGDAPPARVRSGIFFNSPQVTVYVYEGTTGFGNTTTGGRWST